MQNEVSSNVYEGERQEKKNVKEGRGERREKKWKRRKRRKNKRRRFSLDPSRSGLSHFEGGFPKVLRDWIPGFGGIKERRQRGSSSESYRYEHCMLLSFHLRLSLPLMFAASF